MRMECSYIYLWESSTPSYTPSSPFNHLCQDVTGPLMKTPSAELSGSGMAENRAVRPGFLRRHRELAKAAAHTC